MKTTGQLLSVSIDVTEPFEFSAKELTMRNISLFTGKNSTGKSFCLVNFFCLGHLTAAIIQSRIWELPFEPIAFAQHTWDHSFSEQNLTGTVEALWESGATLSVTFLKGKVCNVQHTGMDDLEAAVPVKFMSSQMRTFDAISMYMKMRKLVAETCGEDNSLLAGQMLKSYKLYDVLYLESMMVRMPVEADERIKKALSGFDITEDIRTFNVDYDKCDFYVTIGEEQKPKYLTTYGKGDQSIFNMTLGSFL
jgi:hypothetical protein